MIHQSPMAAETAEIVHRRSDKARVDPTSPLCLGVAVGTDEPVTLLRTERFDPIFITGQMGMGTTTLCQQIARQQLTPGNSLCYITPHDHSLTELRQTVPEDRAFVTITPDADGKTLVVTDLPADIGTARSLSGVMLGTERESNTAFLNTLIEDVLVTRHRQRGPEILPCTLICNGIDALDEMNRLDLVRLFGEARKLRLHIVLAVQSLTSLPQSVQQRLEEYVQTALTGQVESADARALAGWYTRLTADDLASLPASQWWMGSPTAEGVQEAQVRSLPRTESCHGGST